MEEKMKQARRRTSAGFWAGHIEAFKAKPEDNKSDYCKRKGLVYHRFLYWYEKYKSKRIVDPAKKWMNLVTEKPESSTTTIHCEFEFQNGTKLRLQSQESLDMLGPLIQMMAC